LGLHWKVKAFIQGTVARFPSRSSYAAYYWLQRTFGTLRSYDPTYGWLAAVEFWKRLKGLGREPIGKSFLEVGTGRAPIVPLAFHLMGAGQTTTIDLNPYLRPELLAAALRHMRHHAEQTRMLFGPFLNDDRWSRLMAVSLDHFDAPSVLRLCDIRYIAPGDAARSGLDGASVDYHTSYTTLEHIPRDVIVAILSEGDRLLREDGLFIHLIDYSDHFSHSDSAISPINFLQYSQPQWARYANNRYMYMNRLRHDEMVEIFGAARRRIILNEPAVDELLLQTLRAGGFKLDADFAAKDPHTLATTGAWIVAGRGAIEGR
jgi:hypothetical protein